MDTELMRFIEHKLDDKIILMPYGSGKIETATGRNLFIKQGSHSLTYRCEANGLSELSKAAYVPEVVLVGDRFIITAWLDSETPGDEFYTVLGRMVASVHRVTSDDYGFYEDNFIGGNLQQNIPDKASKFNWADFYYNMRLEPQFRIAIDNGYGRELNSIRIRKVEAAVSSLISGVDVEPSLLHGDLWGGNYICATGSVPYLIDPAVYYGDRETDIAMTLLFGGFPEDFYRAYYEDFPLREGWRERVPLYQLYHILNHLNLFGAGYLKQALSIMDRL